MSTHPNDEQISVITEETSTLEKVLLLLHTQETRAIERLKVEEHRARALTSDIVGTRRAEDKAMLASDEAVSHALRDKKHTELIGLAKLIKKPYFARIKLEEETDTATKELEYKIGFSANPECRIIDWRKAPLSKLYYQHQEGDEYSEEIQGKERLGRIVLKNRVEIEKSELLKITCRQGMLHKTPEGWIVADSPSRQRVAGSYRQLPEVLSLLTPVQFKAITEEATSAVLIQGIAGSGKTTVALHRLSWLLFENNSELTADECLILTRSSALKAYLQNSLPLLELESVKVQTYKEWIHRSLQQCDSSVDVSAQRSHALSPCPSSIERLKRSFAMLKSVETIATSLQPQTIHDAKNIIISALSNPRAFLLYDKSRLLNEDLVKASKVRTEEMFSKGLFDVCDEPLLLRILQIGKKVSSLLHHLVVDEIQDFAATELSTLIASVPTPADLTLVGDFAQSLTPESPFPGWEQLMEHWNFTPEDSKYLTLQVSHRSTLPIMKIAEHIRPENKVKEGRQGRTPIWFRCGSEEKGVETVVDWINRAIEKYPNAITAVLCNNSQEARFAYSLLNPTLGELVRLGDGDLFTFEEGVLVSPISEVKGLEFCNVVIWNPSKEAYPDEEFIRNLLYVGITRAEENLCLVTWDAPSKILPPFNSHLVRGIKMSLEEDE